MMMNKKEISKRFVSMLLIIVSVWGMVTLYAVLHDQYIVRIAPALVRITNSTIAAERLRANTFGCVTSSAVADVSGPTEPRGAHEGNEWNDASDPVASSDAVEASHPHESLPRRTASLRCLAVAGARSPLAHPRLP